MADIRALKLELLADTAAFTSGLKKAQNDTEEFSGKLSNVVGAAAKAFVGLGIAAGGAAIAIGVSAVKAAIEDEKAQASLEQTLRNTVKATDAQVKATEAYIDATQRSVGVADDQLRPSLQRLLVSTNDLSKAQQLQKLALDVAAGSGKSLAEVSDILGKAYDGNYKALKNLGVELKTTNTVTKTLKVSKSDLAKQELANESATLRVQSAQERLNKVLNNSKSDALDIARAQNALEKAQLSAASASDKYEESVAKQGKTVKVTKEENVSFDEILKQLTATYSGQAQKQAETFAGQMQILGIRISEAKEQLGTALLPAINEFAKKYLPPALDALEDFVNGLTGAAPASLKNSLRDAKGRVEELSAGVDQPDSTGGYSLGAAMRRLAITVDETSKKLFGATGDESGFKQLLDVLTAIVNATDAAITGITNVRNSTLGEAILPSRTPPAGGGLVGIPKLIAESALVQSGKQLITGQGTGRGVVVNQNVYYGSTNSTSTARTVTSSINKAIKTGVTNKLSSNAVLR